MTQSKTSAVPFAGRARIHISLNVSDLDASISFYRQVFDQEPTKVRSDYAKFEPAEPSVNLALNRRSFQPAVPGGLSHLGVQLQDLDQLAATRERLQAAGLIEYEECRTTCCYALQDKFWLKDPDGNALEFFVVLHADASPAPAPAEAALAR